uniref:Polycomb protein Asx n=1 Tax=Lygus hesperus TaxID=30085 RepID=A0A0A9WLZ0_LYGHE
MEEKTDLVPQFPPKHSGDEASVDSVEQAITDDKKASAEGLQVLNQAEKDKGSPSKVNKKVIKHALRQQAKRRRKNTTIAAGGGTSNVPVHRLNSSPHCELEEMTSDTSNYRQPTMAEVLSSIPGFNLRVPSRKRSNKKLSAAAQIEQTREGCVDLESPDSILVNTNLRQLLNRHTFASLPQLYQYKLLQLLPHVDRVPTQTETMYRLSSSGLNNEFFARACLDWRERLAEGEFTPENQAKLKAEQEKEKSKLDPWKLKHFEPMWGESLREWPSLPPGTLSGGNTAVGVTPAITSPSTGNKKELLRGTSLGAPKTPKDKPIPVRTVGAVTRAVTSYREKKAAQESTPKSDTGSSPGKDTKEVKPDKSPDSTTQGVAVCKEKKKEQTVDKQLPIELIQCDSELKLDVAEEIVETGGTFVAEEDDMKGESHMVCDVKEEEPIVFEAGTSSKDILDNEGIAEVEVISIPTTSRELSPLSRRKRRSPEVVDSVNDIIQLSPPQPKRSKSAEKESPDLVVPALAIDSCSLEMEVTRDSMTTTEVPEIFPEEGSLVIAEPQEEIDTTEAVSQNVEVVELPIQTDPAEDVMEDMSGQESHMELEPLEAAEVKADVHLTEPPSDVVLDSVEVPTDSVELPVTSVVVQGELEVNVDSNQTDAVCPASDDQDFEVDKTLRDVVALEQEVADRQSNQSVKAEALKPAAHLEEWEIIKVDPNEATTEVACSTAPDNTIPTSVAAIPGLSAYGNVLYHEDEELKEDEAALLAAAWDVVGSSSEFQHQVNLNQPVSVIPCQEELEVRLHESSLPAPQWDYTPQGAKCQPQGHVKLELEVTLTPEVDSSTVTSTCSGANGTKLHLIGKQMGSTHLVSGSAAQNAELLDQNKTSAEMSANPNVATSYGVMSPKTVSSCASPRSSGQISSLRTQQQLQVVVCSNEGPGVTVIPPTTIVCLPPPSVSNTSSPQHPLPPPQHHRPSSVCSTTSQGPPPIAQSSSSLPFIALTTSTPVRALVTKSVTKPTSRSGRNNTNSNRPPPGAVNLERSYQICQAVIQNSPNRHQLRCQLKPPPALLGKTSVSNTANNRVQSSGNVNVANRSGGRVGLVQQPIGNAAAPTSRSHVVFRHVFASSAGGIPVSMAVLPSVHHQVSEVMRGLELRRSNSAPPHSAEATRGVRPPSAPPLPPPFATSASQTNNGNSSSNCSCSLKAMIACVMCGAFCHDDCLASPTSRICVMCCDTR